MSPKDICELLAQIVRALPPKPDVKIDFPGKPDSFTITFTEQFGQAGALRIYRNGEQLIGWEKFCEDYAAGKTLFAPSNPKGE